MLLARCCFAFTRSMRNILSHTITHTHLRSANKYYPKSTVAFPEKLFNKMSEQLALRLKKKNKCFKRKKKIKGLNK